MTARHTSFISLAGKMTMISLCTLAAPASAERGPQSADQTLRLVCNGGAENPVCQALSKALGQAGSVDVVDHLPQETPATGMTVRFVETLDRPDALSGHLAWDTAAGASGTGPELELSVMDAFRTPQMLESFAAHLVRLSNLPK